MNLPQDPVMLLSVINTELRDRYRSLEELAKAHMVDTKEIIHKLDGIGYEYDPGQNRFL